jgi:hypothetical protein
MRVVLVCVGAAIAGAAAAAMGLTGEATAGQPVVIPAGTEFDLRLQAALSSGAARIDDRFEARTILDYRSGAVVLVPAGTLARGFVGSVRAATVTDRQGSLTLAFEEFRVDGAARAFRLRASVVDLYDGRMTDDASRPAGAVSTPVAGAASRGRLPGVIVGAGGTIAAAVGQNVDLPAGAILRIRLDQPVTIEAVR